MAKQRRLPRLTLSTQIVLGLLFLMLILLALMGIMALYSQ